MKCKFHLSVFCIVVAASGFTTQAVAEPRCAWDQWEALKDVSIEIVDHCISQSIVSTDDLSVALRSATYDDNIDLARHLLEIGADPALPEAIAYRVVQSTGMLNEYLPYLSSDQLDSLLLYGNLLSLEAFERLLDLGADPFSRGYGGTSALHTHSWGTGNDDAPEIVERLLQLGLSTEYRNASGDTPLHLVARNNDIEVANILLDFGADVDARNLAGQPPMFYAIQNRNWGRAAKTLGIEIFHSSVFSRLLEAGADVNIPFERGYTLLHIAAERGDELAVNLLLDAGADASVRTDNGSSVLDVALSSSRRRMEEFLESATFFRLRDATFK